jgi:hypothetical protein
LAAFGSVLGSVSTQGSEGVEQFMTVSDKTNTKILQVFRRQSLQDRVVDRVLAECCLILFEA